MAHAWSAAENSWNCIGEVENAKETKPAGAPPGWQHFDVELDNRKMICRHKVANLIRVCQRQLAHADCPRTNRRWETILS